MTSRFSKNIITTAIISTALTALPTIANTLSIDARTQPAAIESGHLNMGSATAPNGSKLEINSQFLTKDGKPWLPIMGEFHYTRTPPQFWEDEILKMKSAGIEIIASYIIWNHHEETSEQFNWSGDRNLREFIALCQKHKMKLVLRLGPWAHGEVRFGGTPDWVANQMPTRRNDPTYLHYVERFWTQVAKQAQGFMWKDGGPIIAVQLENEYNLMGPGMGAEHITTLKKLALKLGFDTPLYTVTGWDGAIYPRGEVVPVFGGYPDEPWGLGTTKMGPNEVYNFRFNSRVAGNAGAQTLASVAGTAIEDFTHTPFLGAEFGSGVPIMYRRRPFIQPEDIGSMLPVQLGSGVNLYGYYMFHGGRNPQGLGNLEENALLGGYNDCPMINYDFQAPFGQYGQSHAVLHKILPYHNFIRNFGERLAPMIAHNPDIEPKGRDDLNTARFSVRSQGNSGFVFMSNHVRQYAMAEQKDVRFSIKLPENNLTFPSNPINIPTGAYFIWPFNFDMDGVNLAWASAQPIARIESSENDITYFFMSENGITPELAIASKAEQKLALNSGKRIQQDGITIISNIKPGNNELLTVKTPEKIIRIVVTTRNNAENMYSGYLEGKTRLIKSPNETIFTTSGLQLRNRNSNEFTIGFFPGLTSKPTADLKLTEKSDGVFQGFSAKAPKKEINAIVTKIREAQTVSPIIIGGAAKAALQPFPEQYGKSAAWTISLPADTLSDLKNAYLQIDYQGDIGRIFSGEKMLDDSFYSGHLWEIGLNYFAKEIQKPLTLTVLPLRKDSPIYIDETIKAALPPQDQVAELKSVKITPEYQLNITTKN